MKDKATPFRSGKVLLKIMALIAALDLVLLALRNAPPPQSTMSARYFDYIGKLQIDDAGEDVSKQCIHRR